jgi:hypothetical protein
MSVYGSDANPEGNDPLLKFSGVITEFSIIQFATKNQYFCML